MIRVFQSAAGVLNETEELCGGRWIHAVCPTPDEIAAIHKTLDIPEECAAAPLNLETRPHIQRYDPEGALLVVLRVPSLESPDLSPRQNTMPFAIAVSPREHVVTISPVDTGVASEIVNSNWQIYSTDYPSQLALRIFLIAARQFIERVRALYREFEDVEAMFEESQRNEDAIALLNLQKRLAYYIKALQGSEAVLERLRRTRLFRAIPQEDRALLEDAISETQLAAKMAETAADFLNQTMSAFNSIVSNNLNAVMRFLAVVTLVLTIPTLLAGLFGMNVRLPLQESPYGFALILCLSALLSGGALIWLKRKHKL